MRKKIKTRKPDSEWRPEGGIESSGKVEKAKIKIKPLSSKASGELESSKSGKTKKKISIPRAPREKGDVTEEAFQSLRKKYKEDPSEINKKNLDELIKNNPEYKEDYELQKIKKRIKTRKK